jgi:predicted nucleic acid-binding protein
MAAILLDTTVLIALLRGRAAAVERLRALRAARDTPSACAINVEEVCRGLRGEREAATAASLFEGLRIVPLGRVQGVQAGEWRRSYAALGRSLTQADCLVAAAALAVGGALATGNPRAFPMPELHVVHWPVG